MSAEENLQRSANVHDATGKSFELEFCAVAMRSRDGRLPVPIT